MWIHFLDEWKLDWTKKMKNIGGIKDSNFIKSINVTWAFIIKEIINYCAHLSIYSGFFLSIVLTGISNLKFIDFFFKIAQTHLMYPLTGTFWGRGHIRTWRCWRHKTPLATDTRGDASFSGSSWRKETRFNSYDRTFKMMV